MTPTSANCQNTAVKARISKSLSKSIIQAYQVIHHSFTIFDPSSLYLTFNGGKDSTVVLHLIFKYLESHYFHQNNGYLPTLASFSGHCLNNTLPSSNQLRKSLQNNKHFPKYKFPPFCQKNELFLWSFDLEILSQFTKSHPSETNFIINSIDESFSSLTKLPDLLTFPHLQSLNISCNSLSEIHIPDIPSLKYLNISNNLTLHTITFSSIEQLQSMKILAYNTHPKLTIRITTPNTQTRHNPVSNYSPKDFPQNISFRASFFDIVFGTILFNSEMTHFDSDIKASRCPEFKFPLYTLFIKHPLEFPEIEEFISTARLEYSMSNFHSFEIRLQDTILSLLTHQTQIDQPPTKLEEHYPIPIDFAAFFAGIRSTDPTGANLNLISTTSPDWPPFIQINPVLFWHYSDIWEYILLFSVDYCVLYDQGYTSLGNIHNSKPNPILKISDNDNHTDNQPQPVTHSNSISNNDSSKYYPAHQLGPVLNSLSLDAKMHNQTPDTAPQISFPLFSAVSNNKNEHISPEEPDSPRSSSLNSENNFIDQFERGNRTKS